MRYYINVPSGIRSTEAECSSSFETKPTLYLLATTAGPQKGLFHRFLKQVENLSCLSCHLFSFQESKNLLVCFLNEEASDYDDNEDDEDLGIVATSVLHLRFTPAFWQLHFGFNFSTFFFITLLRKIKIKFFSKS